ncbi:MAG: hypothetical protein ABI559_05475 [Chloroflexota bacterium]
MSDMTSVTGFDAVVQGDLPTRTTAATATQGDADGDVDTDDVIPALSDFAGIDPGAGCADLADANSDGDVVRPTRSASAAFAAGRPMTPAPGCGQAGTWRSGTGPPTASA